MLPSKTDEELKALAKDLYAGRVFTDRHIDNPEMFPMVFMVINFLDENAIKELKENPPGLIYEYLSEAAPRSINGMPSFFSMQMLSQEDTVKMFEFYTKVKGAMDGI